MADTATIDNKVTIEDAGPSRKKISIEIPAAAVDAKISESIDSLTSEVNIPGFRKGRAPRRLVEKRFGENVRSEAKNQLISTAYTQAIESNELKVIGEPSMEDYADVEMVDGKPLSFDIEVEVMPEFELPELKGIKVLQPDSKLPEGLIDEEIGKICINEGTLEERDSSEPGDYCTGHGIMTDDDGTEHYNIEGAVVQLPAKDSDGAGMILGVMVKDLAKQVGTPKPGDTKKIKVKGPEQHEVEALRGKDLTVEFKIERVDRIVAAPVADVVARLGMTSEGQLREFVETRLDQRAVTQQRVVMRQQIAKHLSDSVEFDLPEKLTAKQAERALERRRMELMYRGTDAQEIEENLAELRASSAEQAARELKLFFILNKAAESLEVQVEEAEINGAIAQMAAEQGHRPEALRQELISSGRIKTVFQQVREHKTLDMILNDAKIEEVSAEDFNKRMADAG